MSHLLFKSSGNLRAAEVMKTTRDFYHSSVHCSYYACYQLVKHIFYNVIDPPIPLPTDRTVHNIIPRTLFHEVGKYDRNLADYIHNHYAELHTFRKQSDYDDTEVTEGEANKAYELAEFICKGLRSNYVK
jgi:uncharacterized protein (UPF0332 family)